MKICKTCKITKNESEFYKHKLTKDGLWPECKECNIKRSTKWISGHRERKRLFDRKSWKKHRKERLKSSKVCWNKRDFGGLREIVLKRDNYKCVKCGMTRKEHLKKWSVDINVDHINRNRKENILDNLQTICLKCHGSKSGKDGAGILRKQF